MDMDFVILKVRHPTLKFHSLVQNVLWQDNEIKT